MKLEYTVGPHATQQTELKIVVPMEERQKLIAHLTPVLSGGEVKLKLGPDPFEPLWLIYWKIRNTGIRAMLAHPEPERWVATIAIEKAVLTRFLDALGQQAEVSLEDFAPFEPFSNFHLKIHP